jgi:acyl-coenzyme A thioesterase PaaI-like protein
MALTASEVNLALPQIWDGVSATCVELSPAHAVAEISLEGVSLRPGGFIPGPTQFAAADVVLWFLVFGAIGRLEPMALTSELSLRFLRPSVGTRLFARATLDRAGRSSVVGTTRVWTDDNEAKPCSVAQGTYALPR